MDTLLQDIRYAVRQLRRSAGFTTVAVVTLALGLGATTAIYTLLKRVVLDPLPYSRPEQLVRFKSSVPGMAPNQEWEMSAGAYFYYQREAKTVSAIGLYQSLSLNIEGAGEPIRAPMARVNADLLPVLGAEMELGRPFTRDDDVPGAVPVTILSDGFWRRQFGGDRTVVGRPVVIQGTSYEIVGILKSGFDVPQERGGVSALHADLWIPLRLNPQGPFYNAHQFRGIARLASGSSVEQAQAEFDQLGTRLTDVLPLAYRADFMKASRFRTIVYPLQSYVVGGVASNLWILFAAVALVLVVAYGNVANLMLVRIEARRREIAIRSALGAGRGDTIRQFLAEGLLLALGGSAIGILLATWGVEVLVRLAPAGLPRITELHVDSGVVGFAALLSLSIAAGLAILPVIHQGGDTRAATLVEGGRSSTVGAGRQRVRSTLLVSQVALALVLVVGAGLLLRSFRALRAVNPGIEPNGVLTVQLTLLPQKYDSLSKIWLFYDALEQRLKGMPGVTEVGTSWSLPFDGNYGCTVQGFEGPEVLERLNRLKINTCADMVAGTTPGYFAALGIPLITGRFFTREDNEHPDRGAVIVSQAFAKRFWGEDDPVGKGVMPFGRQGPPWYRVVGVVGDVFPNSVDEAPANAIYYPVTAIPKTAAWFPGSEYVIIRTTNQDPMILLPSIRQLVHEIDPSLPVAKPASMVSIVDQSMGRVSFTMVLLGVSAGAALLLAAIGLYGVVSYLVARRTAEIGVRVALGAAPSEIGRLVVGGSFRLALIGIAVGAVLAGLGSRVLGNLLYGVPATDPLSYIVAIAVLLSVAVLAAWLPARRAMKVDPIVALRAE